MPRPRPIGRKFGLRQTDLQSSQSSQLLNPELSTKRRCLEDASASASTPPAPTATALSVELSQLPDFDTGFDDSNDGDNVKDSVYGDNFVRSSNSNIQARLTEYRMLPNFPINSKSLPLQETMTLPSLRLMRF